MTRQDIERPSHAHRRHVVEALFRAASVAVVGPEEPRTHGKVPGEHGFGLTDAADLDET